MRSLVILLTFFSVTSIAQTTQHTFDLSDSTFLLDGKPFVMISGELHYPRIPRDAWRQRMRMAKAMGLNTIGTYVFWNLHEPEKGQFDFSGNNDIAAFVKIAQEEGLWVVLRPSPYVCAEWEFGGYPYWLQNEKGLKVRSLEAKFIREYKDYIREVAKQIVPLQINHGGNVLMIQLENEYGFYGNDKNYLQRCKEIFIDAGFDGLLYTCDPAAKIADGHLPPLLPAINGIVAPDEVKRLVRKYHNDKGPFYVAEWYPAWFDWWGTQHHTVAPEGYAAKLDSLLSAGISVNMYMFHGGTTRAFMNGANCNDRDPFEPQTSSYDYDAPLDEAGNATGKFLLFRNVISKNLPTDTYLPEVPAPKPAASIGDIQLTMTTLLGDVVSNGIKNQRPLTFEELSQAYGYVLYRTQIKGGRSGILKINGLRDYAVIIVNGVTYGTLDRRLKQDSMVIQLPQGKVELDLLVENLGRVNFGPYLLENRKGITGVVKFDNTELLEWEMFRLPLTHVATIPFLKSKDGNSPVFKRGHFQLEAPIDTYLDLRSWGKGCAWVNGHNLGRYWSIGPQQTIYVPAEWLKQGNNELIIFEMLDSDQRAVKTLGKPILDHLSERKSTP